MLLITFAVVVLVRIAAIPLNSTLALVCAWFTVPLLIELLWVSTDRPRSPHVRWWLASLAFLLVLDVATTLLAGELRLLVAALALGLAAMAQVAALWPERRATILAEERGWLWLYVAGLSLVGFAVTYSEAAHESGGTGAAVAAAAVAAAAAGIFATALGPRGTGGGIFGFMAVLVILISSVLGNEGTAATMGAVILGVAGQGLILLTILQREERGVLERRATLRAERQRTLLVAEHQWDELLTAP